MGLFDLFKKKEELPQGMRVVEYDPPEQHARIIVDSLNIMNKTTNPDTYFSRYKLASNKACLISGLKASIYNGMTANDIYNMLHNDKDRLHREFIDRLFISKKENQLVYQLHEVGLSMSPETREYFVSKLNGKRFRFCKVKFSNQGNKLYTYVTKDKTIAIGDTVTVPTGNKFVPDSTVLQVVDVFNASLDELDFPIEQLRCVERKLKGITCPHCGASISVDVGKKTGKCEYCQAEFYLL